MNLWEKILTHLEAELNPQTFSTWFRPTRLEAVKGNLLAVRVPNAVFQRWLATDGQASVEQALAALSLNQYRVEYVPEPATEPAAPPDAATNGRPTQPRLDFDSTDYQLNPRYSFQSFVVGSSNQFAHAAALAVAEQPSKAYNPLFLYGGVGLGKTHLMQAVGHRVREHSRALRVSYLSAEKFTNEVINALRFERMVSFRDKYRTVDVLLLDDIQFLAGKERTQEEFFHTFNALYDAQKQIVISSDAAPKEIPTLEERLRSRFEWGLIADIQPPDLETKIAILMKRAETEGLALPAEVAEYIARGIRSNIRELEGAFIRLQAYSSLVGEAVSLSLAETVLKNILAQQEKRISIEAIQRRVAEEFNLRPPDLRVRSNARSIAFPRQIAMYLAKQLTGASLPEIGRAFGGKHHTTVLHSVKKIERLRKADKDLAQRLHKLTDRLG
ncbi:MAG TPA: chromosomal replication initiator protein DnaA [Candidatus Acidoferrales bacterium]|nr:chromosomal replication initiator protein DnaA [Candidatus Acidoferrales bacterium]